MRNAFEFILSKFPEKREKIIALYHSDEDFRILCDDYLESEQTIEACRHKVIEGMETEYDFSQVSLELGKEILHLLDKANK